MISTHRLVLRRNGCGLACFFWCWTIAAYGAPEPEVTTRRPVIHGKQYAVSSMKPLASLVAEHILHSGGNAFDAAVAGQAVLSLVDASNNGIGSDAVLLVYDSRSRKVFSINAEGTAPQLATIKWYQENQNGKLPNNDGLLSGTVPGVVDAWYTLLHRWGTLTFGEVLAPAIEIAETGFPLGEDLAHGIHSSKKLRKYPSTAKIYFEQGEIKSGSIFRNRALAQTLRKLVEAEKANADKGRHEALRAARDRFYKGDIAREMAQFSEENGGLFRYNDFAEYTVKVEVPVSINYRGYQVFKNPSATQAPAELFALNVLEGYDPKKLGHNSPEFIHVCIEAVKLAFADREKYLGDMDFIKIPFGGLLSKDYGRDRRKLIDPLRASLDLRPGIAEAYDKGDPIQRPVESHHAGTADHEGDTSYIAIVDNDRNMISFTPSLHSGFGTGVVMGDLGFTLNCRGDYFSLTPGHANALAPGKRPRSTLQGTLVMKDGQPHMVLGSPGGDDQCQRTMQTFLNIVEFGMNVQQAIEAPRWSTRSFPASQFPHTMYPGEISVEDRIPISVQTALRKKGHKLKTVGAWSIGSNAAIVVDLNTGVLHAGADPRVEAYALAR